MIPLILAVVTGITLLLRYLLGDKRQLRILTERKEKLEDEFRQALANNDTVRISTLSIDLYRVRKAISNRSG